GLFHVFPSISSIIMMVKIKKIVEKHEFLYNLSGMSHSLFNR
ncbi:hypothetical protein ACUXOD_003358, partial [Bacillus sp. 153480037-1]